MPPMSEQPEPTPQEEEQAATERQQEEEATRYPANEDPERVVDPDREA
jgi:hypothetical protein